MRGHRISRLADPAGAARPPRSGCCRLRCRCRPLPASTHGRLHLRELQSNKASQLCVELL